MMEDDNHVSQLHSDHALLVLFEELHFRPQSSDRNPETRALLPIIFLQVDAVGVPAVSGFSSIMPAFLGSKICGIHDNEQRLELIQVRVKIIQVVGTELLVVVGTKGSVMFQNFSLHVLAREDSIPQPEQLEG